MKKLFCSAALAALLASPAGANNLQPNVIARGGFQGAAITTSDQVIVGPGSILPVPQQFISAFLYLENEGSATICIAFGTAATISGGACAGGEITLQPGAFRFFDIAIPADTIHAIGAAAGSLTVGAQ